MNAAGYSQWLPVDWQANWFGIGVAVVLSEDANLTYTVQHSFDSPDLETQDYITNNSVTISRAGAVATVTDNGPYNIGHGLSTGDDVIIMSSGSSQLDTVTGNPPLLSQNGTRSWNVTQTGTTTYTYACANAGPTADNGNAKVIRLRVFPSTLAAQTARGTTTYNYPPKLVRLYVSAYTAGFADLTLIQGGPR
jgi:hypothetical protein